MRVMVIVKATAESEAGGLPTREAFAAMGDFNEELVKAGIMLDANGLKPTSAAARIVFNGKDRTVVDGPFTETKELIAGYWVWQVRSMDEAIEWAKRFPNLMGESALEIRQIFEDEDFADVATPELVEQDARLKGEAARLRGQGAGGRR